MTSTKPKQINRPTASEAQERLIHSDHRKNTMTPANTVQTFLNNLAPKVAIQYQTLIAGISDHFRVYGTLSAKQRKSVRISADKARISVPIELDNFKSEPTCAKPLADMFEEPQPEQPDINERLDAIASMMEGVGESLIHMGHAFIESAEKLIATR